MSITDVARRRSESRLLRGYGPLLGWITAYPGREGLRAGLAQSLQWFADPGNRNHYHHFERYVV